MADFKEGDWVECVDASGREKFGLKQGHTYRIDAIEGSWLKIYAIPSGGSVAYPGLHTFSRFRHTEALPTISYYYVPPLTSRTSDIDARLMAVWLEVPANCCRACSAPLPRAYHPNG